MARRLESLILRLYPISILEMGNEMTYYKVLNEDGTCYHGGTGKWNLPEGDKPSEWMPKILGELAPCKNGYHILKAEQLLDWIAPAALFTVEPKGEELWQGDKGVARQARLLKRVETWTEQTARLFACDCSYHLKDSVPLGQIQEFNACLTVVQRYAFGLASAEELDKAGSWARARASAWARAGSWARARASALARARAWARAGARARASAWARARAWAGVEREWETNRLFEYVNGQVDIEAIRRSLL